MGYQFGRIDLIRERMSMQLQNEKEKRRTIRYETSIISDSAEMENPSIRRGNLNRKGCFYIKALKLDDGTKVHLKIRLPGTAKWISCTGRVERSAKRKNNWGIVGWIERVDEKYRDDILLWQILAK